VVKGRGAKCPLSPRPGFKPGRVQFSEFANFQKSRSRQRDGRQSLYGSKARVLRMRSLFKSPINSLSTSRYNADKLVTFSHTNYHRDFCSLAVERSTRNHKVPGSIPGRGIISDLETGWEMEAKPSTNRKLTQSAFD
jgi:hypothetical protein